MIDKRLGVELRGSPNRLGINRAVFDSVYVFSYGWCIILKPIKTPFKQKTRKLWMDFESVKDTKSSLIIRVRETNFGRPRELFGVCITGSFLAFI